MSLKRYKVILILSIGTLFLPQHPWRHMTATLLYDIIRDVSTALVAKQFHDTRVTGNATTIGSHPLGNIKYNPAEDPYYITNLDRPIDDFIASALDGTKFTNLVHIVLESMRSDSFPYQEDGLLHQHIMKNMEPAEGGVPISTNTVTPFIASLASRTILWDTMWATIPYTHKAVLGRNPKMNRLMLDFCGMVPVPMDWAVEFMEPAKYYQHCLPQIFRYMNSVTDTHSEIMALFNGSRPRTTDQWETVHIQSMTGEWENEAGLLRATGFNTVITAEDIAQFNGDAPHPSTFGYFDEGIVLLMLI